MHRFPITDASRRTIELDSMQPTVIFDSTASVPGQSSLDTSRAAVGFVAGNRPHFSDETAALLRSRLSAAAFVIAAVMAAAFIGNLISGMMSLWWLRSLVLLIITSAGLVLRSRAALSLSQLRSMELIVFGSAMFQLSLMMMTRVAQFAAIDDATSLVSAYQQFLNAWSILIFIYATLMPNSWLRAISIMIPAAIMPYVLLAIQTYFLPNVSELLRVNKATTPLPMPFVAALVATFASHIITAARREAFKARQLGQYRLIEKLGAGGMGEVYKAEHVLLKRPCAIKLIKSSSEANIAAIARFEKEVKTTAKLTHWNTVEIYDYGRTDDGTFYYVMELLPGMSLEELVERHGPLPAERVIHLLRQICGALQEAHSIGLIHRDIKPANIFVSQRGGVFDVAKLLDFGLVKERDEKPDAGTKYGAFSGTPLFMAPEQASSYDEVDGRADLYSLGAVTYYLLTGQPPFTGKNVMELLVAHRNAEVIPPSVHKAGIPVDLEQIVMTCMAKQPGETFSGCRWAAKSA